MIYDYLIDRCHRLRAAQVRHVENRHDAGRDGCGEHDQLPLVFFVICIFAGMAHDGFGRESYRA